MQLHVVQEILDIPSKELHKHLVCVATDGASVNLGVYSGIAVRLRDEWAPRMDNVHCFNHILNVSQRLPSPSRYLALGACFCLRYNLNVCLQLCAARIGKDPIFDECISILRTAYSYCSDSLQRVGALKD